MKFFYLMAISLCLLCGKEAQSVIDDCTTEGKQNLIGNQLDSGQKYCDSNHLIKNKDLKPAEVEDEDLNKFKEFIHSFDCDTNKC